MNPAVAFIQALAQAISASVLYLRHHPARIRAVRAAYDRLRLLQAVDAQPYFSFLGRDVIYGQEPLRELRDWPWAEKCAAAGVQRIEVVTDVRFEDFEMFVDEVYHQLADAVPVSETATTSPTTPVVGASRSSVSSPTSRQQAIRFGEVTIQQGGGAGPRGGFTAGGAQRIPGGFTLHEEADAVRWMHAEVTKHGTVPLVEAEGVVRSLAVALHADGSTMIPLLRIKGFDQYTTTHALNVSVLAMALAEALDHVPRDVRTIGTAGLLHDLGKVRVPPVILAKTGSLSPEEREILNFHPADGARMILNSDHRLTLQAVVAFEHHIMINGGGYPRRHISRDCHHASLLIHVCDVYDALRTERPYREAWASSDILAYIERRAGKEFDPTIAEAFASMIRRHEHAIQSVDEDAAITDASTDPLGVSALNASEISLPLANAT